MRICIFEDRHTADLGPLTLTRPASDLLCGLGSLGEKHARYFGAESVGYLCRPVLADMLRSRPSVVAVNDPTWLRSAPTVLVNARWLPPTPARPRILPVSRHLFASGPAVGMCNGEAAFVVLDPPRLQPVSPATLDDCLDDLIQTLPTHDAGGHVIRRPWDLIDRNPEQLSLDFDFTCDPAAAGFHPTGFAVVGPADRLMVHPSAKIDPMVVADTTAGPVWIDPGAVVAAFTRLEGPCAIGPGTHLLGAKIKAGTTLGPQCRVGGEVECSVVQGYANKYHDGFLGHSYVGEWVNLAAGTITGDLRCDYGPVTVRLNGTVLSTGRTKLGSIIGDHARTGLGVLLDCGTVIGAFATVLPTGRLAPRDVPSFTRVDTDGMSASDSGAVLHTADVVMRRRGKGLTPGLEAVYRAIAGQPAAARRPIIAPPIRKTA